MSLTKIISENITYYREKLGITQKEAAIQAGISPNYWNWIENGTRIPTLETLYKVTHVLNISIAELFSGIETIIPEIKTYIFDVDPNTKPRMTRRDKWEKRTVTTKYWGFKDLIKYQANQKGLHTLPSIIQSIQFIIPMPQSWTKLKKENINGQLHEATPDLDNLLKGLQDALCQEDKHIGLIKGELSKYWGYEGKIIIKI